MVGLNLPPLPAKAETQRCQGECSTAICYLMTICKLQKATHFDATQQ